MPTSVLPVRNVVLSVFILLPVFGNLPDGFVLVVNAAKLLLVGAGEDLLVQNLSFLVFTLK